MPPRSSPLPTLPTDPQVTIEAAEDESFLDAMRRAHIKGALVGVEAVTPEGLKDVVAGSGCARGAHRRCVRA